MRNQIRAGSFTGTGAAFHLEVGFIPTALLLYNITDGNICQTWFDGMTAANSFQGANHASTQFSVITANGITRFEGEAPGRTLTGLLSFTDASATVSGSGTSFLVELRVGDTIRTPAGREYTVSAIASATSLTISSPAVGAEANRICVRRQGRSPGVTIGTTMSVAARVYRFIAIR